MGVGELGGGAPFPVLSTVWTSDCKLLLLQRLYLLSGFFPHLFLQTYSLINCLCLNKLLPPGSENLATYVQVIFFLFIFMLRTSAPVRLFSISFLCLSPESGGKWV